MAKQFTFQVDTPKSEGPQVDFDALTKHMIERVGAEEKEEPMIGIISGIVDLGLQKQEDAKMKWEGTPAMEAAEIEKNPNQYFEDIKDPKTGSVQRFKRWPSKHQREVCVFVDFPDVLVNKGQFFDPESGGEDLPFRGLLNNEFYRKGVGRIVGKPFPCREQRNDDGTWGFKNNTTLFKMAKAAGVLVNGNFKPQHLGSLIGKALLFDVHVYGEEFDGKTYLKEKLSFNGSVPKAMEKLIPTLDEKHMFMVNFKGEQDMDAVKNLRQNVINHMTMAEDFATSDVRKALIELGKIKENDGSASGDAPKAPESRQPSPQPKAVEAPVAALDFDEFDSDIPF